MITETMMMWPYEFGMEHIQHEDGMVECKLSIRIIDGAIISTVLPHEQRTLASIEEFAEFINVEAFNEHWHNEETTK